MFKLDKDIIINVILIFLLIITLYLLLKPFYSENFVNYRHKKYNKKQKKNNKRKIKKNIKKDILPGALSLNKKMYFKNLDNLDNNYYIEKIRNAPDDNNLRLTINNNPNDKFEIWRNSCNSSDCMDYGVVAHSFDATGKAMHNKLCLFKTGLDSCIDGDNLEKLFN